MNTSSNYTRQKTLEDCAVKKSDDMRTMIPLSFHVQLKEWESDPWKGRKFINIDLKFSDGSRERLVIWPSEANYLMNMLKEAVNRADISYGIEEAEKEYCMYQDTETEGRPMDGNDDHK